MTKGRTLLIPYSPKFCANFITVCLCVCVCMCERERERETMIMFLPFLFVYKYLYVSDLPMTLAWSLTRTLPSLLLRLTSSNSSCSTPSCWVVYSHTTFTPPVSHEHIHTHMHTHTHTHTHMWSSHTHIWPSHTHMVIADDTFKSVGLRVPVF